ncbi:hypothetical protein Agau_L100414 [Agrobacterium tumefaciens F2]|nr:hypothetical protein Agau_L100414 [Agrobacterium tumefaciens F2]
MAGWAPAQLSEAKNISEGFPMAEVLVWQCVADDRQKF